MKRGEVEEGAVDHHPPQLLAKQDRQEERAEDGDRHAEHQVEGVGEVVPELAVAEQLDVVLKSDPLEGDRARQLPVREADGEREEDRPRREDQEAEEVRQQEQHGGAEVPAPLPARLAERSWEAACRKLEIAIAADRVALQRLTHGRANLPSPLSEMRLRRSSGWPSPGLAASSAAAPPRCRSRTGSPRPGRRSPSRPARPRCSPPSDSPGRAGTPA